MLTDAPIHATLAVQSVPKARAWYGEKLGWTPFREAEGQDIWQVGDSFFTTFETPNAGTAKNTVMNWNVPDVSAEVERLRKRGVVFEEYDFGEIKTVDGVMSDPSGGKNAWFRDLDGNTVGVLSGAPGELAPHTLSVMLAAGDLARAKGWYAEKLGFEPVAEFGGFVVGYASGDASFNLYLTEFAGSAKNTVAIWRLRGIVDEVARLRSRGVTFDEYPPDEGEHYQDGVLYDDEGPINAWFTDSEGNIVALAEDTGALAG